VHAHLLDKGCRKLVVHHLEANVSSAPMLNWRLLK
jgi:hypothetical protein